MRRLPLVAALLAAALVATPGGIARSKPTVTVARVVPLTVKGSGFRAGERVRVVVRVPRAYQKTIKAGRRGRFVVIFRVPTAKCTVISVVARGSKGSQASTAVAATCVS